MADPTPTPTPSNGVTRTRLDSIRIIATLLGTLLFFEAALIAYCVHTPPAQWDIVTKGIDAINTLTVALTGGLLTALKTGGS